MTAEAHARASHITTRETTRGWEVVLTALGEGAPPITTTLEICPDSNVAAERAMALAAAMGLGVKEKDS